MKFLMWFIGLANLVDAGMTYVCLESGDFAEANPVVQWFITVTGSIVMVMLVKALISIPLFYCAIRWKDRWESESKLIRKFVGPLLVVTSLIYFLVTVNNIINVGLWL